MKSNSKVALVKWLYHGLMGERATVRLPGLRLWVIIGIPPGFSRDPRQSASKEVRAVVHARPLAWPSRSPSGIGDCIVSVR